MKNELERYKKKANKYRILGLVVLFLVGVFCLVAFKFFNNTIKIISCAGFIGAILLFSLFFIILDAQRNHLVKKYYGTVSHADSFYAKILLENIDALNDLNFKFLFESTVKLHKKNISLILSDLMKGQKINKYTISDIESLMQQIDKSSPEEISENQYSVNYLLRVYKLIQQNLVDL